MAGIRGLLVAALLLLPAYSHALGLGRLKVHSALNEPLNAEIEFTSITDKELKGLNASLGTRADFDAAGIERQPYLSTIKFTVAKRLDGRYILQLQTDQPLDEPFMHFLLQIEWPGGRIIREYSALIDPPVQIIGKPPQVETPAAGAPAREPEPVTEPAPSPAAPEPAPTAQAETPPAAPAPETPPAVETAPPVAEVTPPAAEAAAQAPAAAKPADKPLGATQAPEDVRIDPRTGWPIMDGGTDAMAPVPAPTATAPSVEKLDARPETAPLLPPPSDKPIEPEVRPSAAEPSVPSTSPSWSRVAEYHVKPGDTMWAIADRIRTDKQIALEQVVLAIYRTNRTAFFGNNVNNLRAGKILKIPEREAIESQPAAQARREFRAQYDVWQEYKLKLASADRAVKVPEEASREPQEPAKKPEEPKKPAAAKPAAEAKPAAGKPPVTKAEAKPDKPAVPPAGRAPQEELLRIVRSSIKDDKKKGTPEKKVETEAVKDAKERQALAERVASLEESAISRQIQARDLSDKIGAVRAQLKREKRLMELESQRLAESTVKPAPAEKKETAKPEEKKPEAKPEAKKPEEQKKPEEKKPEVVAAAPVKPPVEVKKAPPARRPAATPPAPPKEDKGFVAEMMDTVLGSDLMPVFMGGIVLVTGLIAVAYLRRRRRAIGEFEESILSSSEGTTDQPLMTTDTSGQAVPAGDTSFLSDFSQGGVGTAHTDEVDPIAEAEVYLAYGRDETAEEILKDAIVKNPERNEIKVKLLEVYHQRNDVRGFETLAEELYAALGGHGGKLWEKVEEMGRKLNPDNPMFRGGAPGGASKAAPKKGAATTPSLASTGQSHTSPGMTAPAAADTGTIDFNQTMQGEAAPAASETSIDFDMGFTQAPAAPAEYMPGMAEPEALGAGDKGLGDIDLGQSAAEPESSGVDFDLGGLADESPAVVPEASPPAADGGLDFDFGSATETGSEIAVADQPAAGGDAGSAQWDETATKLDLAKAYIDMGDAEGARSILDEVMSEGNDSQKSQARELAAQLG